MSGLLNFAELFLGFKTTKTNSTASVNLGFSYFSEKPCAIRFQLPLSGAQGRERVEWHKAKGQVKLVNLYHGSLFFFFNTFLVGATKVNVNLLICSTSTDVHVQNVVVDTWTEQHTPFWTVSMMLTA